MKANEVLSLLNISRPTLTKYVKNGWIKVDVLQNNRYRYDEKSIYEFLNKSIDRKVVIYARVSTNKQKKDLDNQIEMLKKYCYENGYKLSAVYSDIASGINYDNRVQFFKLFDEIYNGKIDKVIISYKDRLSRIGFGLFVKIFEKFGTRIEVVSEVGSTKLDSEEIFEEIVTLIHSFSMKLYSSRKGNNIYIEEKQ